MKYSSVVGKKDPDDNLNFLERRVGEKWALLELVPKTRIELVTVSQEEKTCSGSIHGQKKKRLVTGK